MISRAGIFWTGFIDEYVISADDLKIKMMYLPEYLFPVLILLLLHVTICFSTSPLFIERFSKIMVALLVSVALYPSSAKPYTSRTYM